MNKAQAQALAERIKREAPKVEVNIKPMAGNEWVCRLGTRMQPYYLWSVHDWLACRDIRYGVKTAKAEVSV